MEEKNKAETKCAVITNKYSQRNLSNKKERRINPKPNYYISSFVFRKIVNLIVLSTSVSFLDQIIPFVVFKSPNIEPEK